MSIVDQFTLVLQDFTLYQAPAFCIQLVLIKRIKNEKSWIMDSGLFTAEQPIDR
jgi:hypothetical protein